MEQLSFLYAERTWSSPRQRRMGKDFLRSSRRVKATGLWPWGSRPSQNRRRTGHPVHCWCRISKAGPYGSWLSVRRRAITCAFSRGWGLAHLSIVRITTEGAAPPFALFKGWELRTLAPRDVFSFSLLSPMLLKFLARRNLLNRILWRPAFENSEGWGSRVWIMRKGGPAPKERKHGARPQSWWFKQQRVGQPPTLTEDG